MYIDIITIVAYFYSAFAYKRRGTWINKPFLLIMQLNEVVQNALKMGVFNAKICLGVPKNRCFLNKINNY